MMTQDSWNERQSDPPIAYFKSQFPVLKEQDIRDVLEISTLHTFDRHHVLIPAGTTRKVIAFVVSGLVRAYYIKENGQEMTPFFWPEKGILASWESIYLGRPSQLNFEVLEPSTIVLTDYVAFKKLVDSNDAIRRTYLDMVEVILTNTLIQTQLEKNEKPEDRYLHFLQENPDIAGRISQKHMASYLGITPISFSRMKKRLEKKSKGV